MIDKEAVKYHIRGLLEAIGDDPDREGLKETPDRVARMYEEVFAGISYTNDEIAEMFSKALGIDADAIIHVVENSFNQRRCLDFLFELPNYVNGRFSGPRSPQLRDYIRTIRDNAEMVNNDIVKGPQPVVKPELYVSVLYIDSDPSHE